MSAFDHDDAERRARIDLLLLDIECRIAEIAATRGSIGQISADTAVAREEFRTSDRRFIITVIAASATLLAAGGALFAAGSAIWKAPTPIVIQMQAPK